MTFVYVTHDQEEALAMSDRVAVMHRGRIEQLASPREIYDSPATPFVADFIGETNFIRRDGAVIAVRPERLRIARAPHAPERGIAGELVATMVVGPSVQCVVRTDAGEDILVRWQRTEEDAEVESLAQGERVVVTWAADAALTLGKGDEIDV